MGGTGMSFGPASMGGSPGGGGSGKGVMPFFGVREAGAGALAGTFYDLKQTQDRRSTGMNPHKYAAELTAFIKAGWPDSFFSSKYFKGPAALYSNQVFIPDIDANKGPTAFSLEKEVQPSMWIVVYKGMVSPPKSGVYHFVGHGDDILMVRLNGKLVLEANWDNPQFGTVDVNPWRPTGTYQYDWPTRNTPYPFRKGDAMDLRESSYYPIEIIIGEQPGGRGHAVLMIEEEGASYSKDSRGNPLLPIFRMGDTQMPKLEGGETLPPHMENGPVWKFRRVFGGGLDIFHH